MRIMKVLFVNLSSKNSLIKTNIIKRNRFFFHLMNFNVIQNLPLFKMGEFF